jgi:hypothetical protein
MYEGESLQSESVLIRSSIWAPPYDSDAAWDESLLCQQFSAS